MKSNCGLGEEAIKIISKNLSVFLADLHQLYIKSLAYHWNVEDPRFHQLHALFQEGYEQLAEDIDDVAERIRKLGERAPGSVEQLTKLKRLKDTDPTANADEMIALLASDYEALLLFIRQDIETAEKHGDPGTADLLTAILRQYEKRAWILRSHLV